MNYRILFILALLVSFSCGTSKKHREHTLHSYSLTDSSLFRGTANRLISEKLLSRHIRLAAPDSTGKQAIESLTETRLIRTGTDSIFVEQQNKSTQREALDYSMQQTRETTSSVSVHPFIWFSIAVLIVYSILRGKSN